ncbi:MAG: hypothetical protein K6F60_02395 [Eubacterium sp.]|nr:hypothetical protein [Eubacterium sp.]
MMKKVKTNNKRLIMAFVSALVFLAAILGQGFGSEAMTPRVMLTEYSIKASDSSGKIYPGDTFEVTFRLKNTSKNKIQNLKYTVASDNGDFLAAEGVGTGYISEMNGEAEEEYSVKLQAVKTLEEKTYSLKIKTEYEDWNGSYKSEDTIYVPISLKTDVLVSDTYIAEEEIHLGDNIELVSTINNTGAAKIYKVTARVEGHNIADASTYIGNVDPGKNANIDIITKATTHDDIQDATEYDNDLIITYEDIDGNEYTVKEPLGKIEVLEQDYSDVIMIKEDTEKHMSGAAKSGIVISIVAVLLLIIVIKRVLKRKKLEREFN